MSKPLFHVVGAQSNLTVYPTHLTIAPSGCLALLSGHYFRGAKSLPLKSITGVQVKPAGITNGYIQFTIGGGNESTGGILAAAKDENSFMFPRAANATIRKVEAYILERQTDRAAPADELAKLAALRDSGALTDEEFAAAKARVLG